MRSLWSASLEAVCGWAEDLSQPAPPWTARQQSARSGVQTCFPRTSSYSPRSGRSIGCGATVICLKWTRLRFECTTQMGAQQTFPRCKRTRLTRTCSEHHTYLRAVPRRSYVEFSGSHQLRAVRKHTHTKKTRLKTMEATTTNSGWPQSSLDAVNRPSGARCSTPMGISAL